MRTITGEFLQDTLLHLLNCALKGEKPSFSTVPDWEALLKLARRQQV